MIVTATEGRDIRIGKVGENEATVVRFDVSRILSEFPGASVTILNQRPGDKDAYPVNGQYVELHGTTVDWVVQSGDLTKKGVGMCQLVATLDSVIVKTVIYSTKIERALGDSATPPEPWESWVSEVTDAAERAEDAAELLENPGAVAATLGPNDDATANYSNGVFTFGIPRGRDGGELIDDTAGAGDKDKTWSADKLYTDITGKAEKNNTEITGSLSMGRKSGSDVGANSTALGNNVVASGLYAHAEGTSYTTSGITRDSTASGTASHAEGGGTTASGNYSHAEGAFTEATGSGSHAEGTRTVASGLNSHAEGSYTEASGSYSHAEGNRSNAMGLYAHAEGNNTFANGSYSHAEGDHTDTSLKYMHAAGAYNVTSMKYPEWVSGTTYNAGDCVLYFNSGYRCVTSNSDTVFDSSKWELAQSDGPDVFVVGNGSGNTAKSNAYKLDWNGNGYYAGDIYAGCNSDSTGGNKVATVADLHQVPAGGSTGQVLKKQTGTSYDIAWADDNTAEIDDTAGAGDTDKVWSADKVSGEFDGANSQVLISDDEPTEETNKIWIDPEADEQYTVPTYTEFSTLSETVSGKYTKPSDGIPASDIASGVIPIVHNVPEGGTEGQVLAKASENDYDLTWTNHPAITSLIDDTAGSGATAKVWSADKSYSESLLKQGKITVSGILKGDGNGGISAATAGTDYIVSHQDISGKADKVSSATNGNFAGLDSNGNLTDSGHKHSDYLTSHQDISGKADKSGTVLSTTLSLGRKANTTVGTNSVALGDNITSSGSQSFAINHSTVASGAFSVATGYGTTASGKGSFAGGLNSNAYGETSFAHGQAVTSNSNGMAVVGVYNATANLFPDWAANTSYAVGDKVKTSNGIGYVCNTANSDASFTDSKWTKMYTNGDMAFVVGNGITMANRSNAMMVGWDGNGYFNGDLYVNCSASSTNGTKVATETVVENVSGSTPSITGVANHRYMCGTVDSISITVPADGIVDVVFTSGATPATLTVTPPAGKTMKWPGWFSSSALDASTIYEISIEDGNLGVVMGWQT